MELSCAIYLEAHLSSDFNSRHPQQCNDESCQIRQFLNSVDQSVVRGLTVKDIIDGHIRMPFISRNAWLQIQKECNELRRIHAQLIQGMRSSKKPAKFDHPSSYQLKQIINRYFIALDLDKAISQVAMACHVCNSLKSIPNYLRTQSTTDIPNTIGVSYAAGIMCCYNQLTFVLQCT